MKMFKPSRLNPNKKGFTFIDAVVMLVLAAVMAVGGMAFFSTLISQHQKIVNLMSTMDLASAQMEDIIALDWAANATLVTTGTTHATTLTSLPSGFGVTYLVTSGLTPSINLAPITFAFTYYYITVTATGPNSLQAKLIGFKAQ